jgi:small-conductance mechanosensitive channel
MRVASFDVLTTTFTLPDGRALTIPNSQLATMSISNLRYSGAATIAMAVRVAFDTPAERIDALQRALAAFTATRPLLWRAPATLSVSEVVPGSYVELSLGAEPVHGWQRSARMAAARGELLAVLLQSLRENAITCTETVKPIIVLEDGAKSLVAALARAK